MVVVSESWSDKAVSAPRSRFAPKVTPRACAARSSKITSGTLLPGHLTLLGLRSVSRRGGKPRLGGGGAKVSDLPQPPQNFSLPSFRNPHDGHAEANESPHSLQKRRPSRFSARHRGHCIAPLPRGCANSFILTAGRNGTTRGCHLQGWSCRAKQEASCGLVRTGATLQRSGI